MMEEIGKTYNDVINNIKQDINKTQLDIMINTNISLVNLNLKENSDLVSNIMKNPYVFDILELTNDYKEK